MSNISVKDASNNTISVPVTPIGQQVSVNSVGVVIASDQSAVNVAFSNNTVAFTSTANVAINAGLPTGANTIGAVNLDLGGSAIAAGNPLPIYDAFQAPTTTSWANTTALNTAVTVTTAGYDTVIFTVVPTSALTAGAVTFEAYDGFNWVTIKAPRTDSYLTDATFTLSGNPGQHSWQVPVAGYPQARVRLSTAMTGTGSTTIVSIVSSAPDTSLVTVGLDPTSPLPAGTNTLGNVGVLPYTGVQTPVANSATAAATAIAPVLAAQAGKTNYIAGFEITGGGATAASVITATITGTATTLSYAIPIPAGVTLGINPVIVKFMPPIPASAINTAITLNVPSFGAGNTIEAGVIHGFYQ